MPTRTWRLTELVEHFESLSNLATVQAAIGVRDPEVAAYARVLEYGSIVGERPWPAPAPGTALTVDPETGAQVVVSRRAPQGFIRLQAAGIPALIAGYLRSPADWLEGKAAQSHVAGALARASRDALELLRAAAPRDSGRLAGGLELVSE